MFILASVLYFQTSLFSTHGWVKKIEKYISIYWNQLLIYSKKLDLIYRKTYFLCVRVIIHFDPCITYAIDRENLLYHKKTTVQIETDKGLSGSRMGCICLSFVEFWIEPNASELSVMGGGHLISPHSIFKCLRSLFYTEIAAGQCHSFTPQVKKVSSYSTKLCICLCKINVYCYLNSHF